MKVILNRTNDHHWVPVKNVKFYQEVAVVSLEEIVPGVKCIELDAQLTDEWDWTQSGTIRNVDLGAGGLMSVQWDRVEKGTYAGKPWLTFKPIKIMVDINDDGVYMSVLF